MELLNSGQHDGVPVIALEDYLVLGEESKTPYEHGFVRVSPEDLDGRWRAVLLAASESTLLLEGDLEYYHEFLGVVDLLPRSIIRVRLSQITTDNIVTLITAEKELRPQDTLVIYDGCGYDPVMTALRILSSLEPVCEVVVSTKDIAIMEFAASCGFRLAL